MTTRYAPAPWHLKQSRLEDYDNALIAVLATDKESAALIAASPLLLEALQELVLSAMDEDDTRSDEHLYYTCLECDNEAEDDYTKIVHEPDCVVGRAQAAIAKATGQSS